MPDIRLVLCSSPDTGGLTAGAGVSRYTVFAPYSSGGSAAGRDFVRTNTSGQIYVSANAIGSGVTYWISTFGWNDRRGRDN